MRILQDCGSGIARTVGGFRFERSVRQLYFLQKMPAVTVIVNLFNGRDTLAETIASVIAQTFSDWELLVWDDGSTDRSAEILNQFTDARIRYFRSEAQLPLGQARQRAIDMATGKWVAFLDQDDLWLPGKLERQLALDRAKPEAALIYGRTVRFYPNCSKRDYDQAHEYAPLPEGDIFTSLFTDSCYIAMSSAMFRRSAIEEIGGIPEAIGIIPDYYLYLEVSRRHPAAAVQEVVCRYRMHGGSTSHTSAAAVQEEAFRLMDMYSDAVDPALLERCKRRHSTELALAEMRSRQTFFGGLRRLFRDGSPGTQLLRPFYFVFHLARRHLVTPHWKRTVQ
jgi:glycosyltransferase involved in cell wall biosynthesis